LPHDEPPRIPLSTWIRSLTLPISALIISITTLALGF
jgi:hypothetical protein